MQKILSNWARNPELMVRSCWPHVRFYDKQWDIIYSVRDNQETYVPAGNKLGKDFVAGFIALWWFVTHHPSRVVTTSATDEHLDVLWGEIDRYLRTSEVPLTVDKGGTLVYNHHDITRVWNGQREEAWYLIGKVAKTEKRGEGLQGHHTPNHCSLFICDEASGVGNIAYEMAQGWADRMLIIGNPFPCSNFFFRAVEAGDLAANV